MKKKLRVVVLLIAALLAAAVFIYQRAEDFAGQRLAISQETIFTLPAGTGRTGLEALLTEQKVLAPSPWFAWLLRIEPSLANVKAGTFRFTPGMTVRDMLALLVSGKEAQFALRLIEGLRLHDWLQVMQAAPYLKHQLTGKDEAAIAAALGMKPGEPVEGRLYPDTYLYTAGMSDLSLLKRAYTRMQKTAEEIWSQRAPNLPYKTPNDLLTMASIIEKETAVSDERDEVASVFINRLRIGMRLQTDPTVIYGMGEAYKGNITRKDLETPTPYNTYVISGLPPTPIAMPSLASMQAAAHPAKTAYLYFVANGTGGHTFSTNLENHNKAVQRYREILKTSAGR